MVVRGSGGVTFANQRRSQRILLAVPLSVSARRADGTAFIERASTLIVSASGALVTLKELVLVGQILSLTNENTNGEISCAVVNFERQANGLHEVGIEFSGEHKNFWRVNFPPADWTSRSPDAKRFEHETPTTATKTPTLRR
jgi:PilZ domain